MPKQLFPKEIIENTVEVHQFKHNRKTSIIYTIILMSLLIGFISLPFIKITVSETSQGMLRSESDRIWVQNLTSGEVIQKSLKNNSLVKKGDTLLVLSNKTNIQEKANIEAQIIEHKEFIIDLKQLSTLNRASNLGSLKYKQEFQSYQQKLRELQTRFLKAKQDYFRNKQLFEKGVIAKITLNDQRLNYDLAINAIKQLKNQHKSSWQATLITTQNALKELEATKIKLNEEGRLSVIKAPISGVVLNMNGIEQGAFLPAGTKLTEISPNTAIVAECYVSPETIGLLKKENKVSFQVSSFNYNQWGLATGTIKEIGNDVQWIDKQPVFRVLCSLDQDYLSLQNGFKGYFKKGMTVQARFDIAKRSLFDLLYDKVDDWLNPNIAQTPQ
ncbi:HlyD family secretion protein [Tenacibaculum xiamenense]|uniref:HlyD family secretion protein n=1 Tax=Tenacibaculum xiamenense TaxID=1261553 RepID=UPI003892D65D